MNRYYTFMFIPEKEGQITSFRLPRFLIQSLSTIIVILLFMIGILIYDYKQILNQVYENKQLTLQNQKLKDQLGIFQMKMNAMTEDIERIHIFEKKLRTITGIDQGKEKRETASQNLKENNLSLNTLTTPLSLEALTLPLPKQVEEIENNNEYIRLTSRYSDQILKEIGQSPKSQITGQWIGMATQGRQMAKQFAFFDYRYDRMKKIVEALELSLHDLDEHLLNQDSVLRSTPSLLPCKGWITSYFGVRPSPYSGRLKIHEGLDLGAERGTPIVAPADGIVVYAGQRAGFGKFVQIDHGHGLASLYGHCDRLITTYGQKVQRGDPIATVGNTGLSTGPHLHYEVRVNGVAVDPLYYALD